MQPLYITYYGNTCTSLLARQQLLALYVLAIILCNSILQQGYNIYNRTAVFHVWVLTQNNWEQICKVPFSVVEGVRL